MGTPWAARLLRWVFVPGCIAVATLLGWWLFQAVTRNPWAAVGFGATLAYAACQLLPSWIVYLVARPPRPVPAWPEDLTVDVFVTACREPVGLVENCLSAACRMNGPHRTYLLDDGDDPALGELAGRYGAGYLTRADGRNAKAGNLNAALPLTWGDVIAIFDVDHVPTPDFLEKTVGHFADPSVGFVQTMVTFHNAADTWIAQAAAETSLDFYNPTSLGMDAVGGVTKMGTNSLLRRAALAGIGGYRPGLAEDLATSVAAHAAGWQSRYVAEPLAPGLAPVSVSAWFTQQMKWARGVFEVLLTDLPRLWPRLTPWQRLCYGVRTTKYWIGPVIAAHLFVTLAVIGSAASGVPAGAAAFRNYEEYLLLLLLVAASDFFMRATAMAAWRHPTVGRASLWRAVSLVVFTWPVYTLAWLMAVLRLPLGFRPTPKNGDDGVSLLWIAPQVFTTALLLGGVAEVFRTGGASWRAFPLTLAFAAAQAGIGLLVVSQRFRPSRLAGIVRRMQAGRATPRAGA